MKWVLRPIYKQVDTGELNASGDVLYKEELDSYAIRHKTTGIGPKGTITIPGPDIPKAHAKVEISEGGVSVVEDATLKSEAEANKATEAAIQQKLDRMAFGNRLIAIISIRNDAKNLITEQVETLINTYAPVIQTLQTGSVDTARAIISSLTPDGVIIVQSDKDAALAEIDANLTVLGYK